MAEDFRDEPRKPALKAGQISFGAPQDSLDCLVWDLSKSGAMIEVDLHSSPPDTFRLLSAGLSLNQRCEVIWRSDRKIGVKFVD
ncbi:PilZ domain-containing protein [Methylobacterium sp. GC_Met_2]|uniref:PilZ domain-containing protein n=1 Tax=Methylobacterium sp. GC_Met_2 TaxID=2937376 RepID=UPI00226B2B57|nr:PilZ domain-containing protein [Methylobacterium sp. GC_Met_2]